MTLSFEDTYKHKGQRKSLVKTVKSKGIRDDRILQAIEKIPRHFFVDNTFDYHAYQDKAFPIGEGQTISQPYTVAFQTELLDIQKGDKVLEVGTGSGYQSCVLLELGAKVYTIENNKKLYQKTRQLLPRMGYEPYFFYGDGSKGLPGYAPFDKIIVTAGARNVPETLIKQLKPGGLMVIPVGGTGHQKMVKVIKENEDKIVQEEHGLFSFVPLTHKKS